MKQTGKRREFLVRQGYSTDVIDFFESCGVRRHLLWFLREFKGLSPNALKSHIVDIRVINEHIESNGKNSFKSLNEAFKSAYSELSKKKGLENTSLHKFEDGHFITLIHASDLHGEGVAMSNCVGNYVDSVKVKERAILALKSPSGETLVHFEIMQNGLVAQNYEKANMPVRNKYWKYVCEFFRVNSKKIGSDKHFGFGWRLCTDLNKRSNKTISMCITTDCVIPRSITKSMANDGKSINTSIDSCEIIKRFEASIPIMKFEGLDKNALLDELRKYKSEVAKSIDSLMSNISITDGEDLFVSDEMKERIFGKGNYLMRGNDYGFLDMTMFSHCNVMAEGIAEPRPQNGLANRHDVGVRVEREEQLPRLFEAPEEPEGRAAVGQELQRAPVPGVLVHGAFENNENEAEIMKEMKEMDEEWAENRPIENVTVL